MVSTYLPCMGQTVMQTILSVIFSCTILYISQKALAFWKATRTIQYAQVPFIVNSPKFEVNRSHPGYRVLFSPLSIFVFLPKIKGVTVGSNHLFDNKHKCQSLDFSGSLTKLPQPSASRFCRCWLGHSYFCELTTLVPRIIKFEPAE